MACDMLDHVFEDCNIYLLEGKLWTSLNVTNPT